MLNQILVFNQVREKNMDKVKVGITHGMGNKMVYETFVRCFSDSNIHEIAQTFIYGLPSILTKTIKDLEIRDFSPNICHSIDSARQRRLNILDIQSINKTLSLTDASSSAELAYAALSTALGSLKNKDLEVLISLNVLEKSIREYRSSYKTKAHYIANAFEGCRPFKMVLNRESRYCFLSSISTDNVLSSFTEEKIFNRLLGLEYSLKRDFGCVAPRIAVLSMNTDLNATNLCVEDEEILKPIINYKIGDSKLVFGPYTPKQFVENAKNYGAFDAIFCFYKEQIDLLQSDISLEKQCYYTVALPIVHIEAVGEDIDCQFDDCDKANLSKYVNIAENKPASSLFSQHNICERAKDDLKQNIMQAVYYALDICRNRKIYDDLNKDPLAFVKKVSE